MSDGADQRSAAFLERLTAALRDRYRIERELGAGGMATVYLAHDLRHHRPVALKVLRPELAEALGHERFLREIEIAAGLSHPHIVPLYDSGEAGGVLFYVMPRVEGESLRDRLRREKQLPLDDAMGIAREVADALSYAHAHGVIHRDIKPENIMLQGGHALVTDFGIAWAVSAAGGARLTETGVAVGTPSYMSPEQAGGERELDGRSDLYALGCVLYEMLAGQPPFTGPTLESVIHQHLAAEPRAITQIRPAVPDDVAGVLQRALAKNPADRFNPVAQFAEALGSRRAATATAPRRSRRWIAPVLAAAAVVAVGAVAGALLLRGGHTTLVVGATTHVTLDPGLEIDAAISPDGSLVAYAAGPPTRMQIFVRQVSGGRTVRLTDDTTMNHRWPRWSPDGVRVAYETGDGTIAEVPALGGAARVLVRLPKDSTPTGDSPPILGFDWSPDGSRLAYVRSGSATAAGIYLQSLSGGAPTLLATVEQAHSPAWSPDGSLIAVAAGNPFFVFGAKYFANEGQSAIVAVPVGGGTPATVVEQAADNVAPTWLPDGGGLLFVSGREGSRDVYRIAIARSGRPRGTPERVTSGLGALSLSLSRDGRRLAYATLTTTSNVYALDIPRGAPVPASAARPVTRGDQTVETADVSPDGAWLAFDSNRGGNYDIWKMPVAGGDPVQVTTSPANDFAPAWSPDGRTLAFHSMRNGNRDLFTIAADGMDERQRTSSPAEELDSHWSPDGRALVYESVTRDRDVLRVLELATGTSRDLWQGEYARWSPAGDAIAAIAPDGLRVGPAAGGASRVLVPKPDRNSGPYLCTWATDGRTLYYLNRDASGWSIRSVPAAGGASRLLVTFGDAVPQPARYAFTTDGRRFYYTAGQREADVWVAELQRR